jgi:hypothetical protein
MFARIKRVVGDAGLLTLLFSLMVFSVALAASGDLDTTFSGDGKVTRISVLFRGDLIRFLVWQSNLMERS